MDEDALVNGDLVNLIVQPVVRARSGLVTADELKLAADGKPRGWVVDDHHRPDAGRAAGLNTALTSSRGAQPGRAQLILHKLSESADTFRRRTPARAAPEAPCRRWCP